MVISCASQHEATPFCDCAWQARRSTMCLKYGPRHDGLCVLCFKLLPAFADVWTAQCSAEKKSGMCSGSFKVLRTVKDWGAQVVRWLYIHDACDSGRERRGCREPAAAMSTVLKRITLPGPEPKMSAWASPDRKMFWSQGRLRWAGCWLHLKSFLKVVIATELTAAFLLNIYLLFPSNSSLVWREIVWGCLLLQ